MTSHYRLVVAAAATLACAGCTTPSHLVFQQTAIIGADISTNGTSQVNLSVGYDRQTTALIPKTKTWVTRPNEKFQYEENEAMAAVAASKVVIKGIGAYEVNEQFATGQAAVNLARGGDAVVSLSTLTETETSPTPTPTPAQQQTSNPERNP